jgi:hypothetical protein
MPTEVADEASQTVAGLPSLFAIPSQPASATAISASPSLRQKRSLQSGETSPEKRSRASSSQSGFTRGSRQFGTATFNQLKDLYTEACWHCSNRSVDLHKAHVFPRNDDNFDLVRSVGLLNLNAHGDFANAMFLCSLCHTAYDHVYKPSLVIVPKHLDYFFDVEQAWQTEAIDHVTIRDAPNAETYFDYCQSFVDREGGRLLSRQQGGLYVAYLDEYIFPTRDVVQPTYAVFDLQWHGDPMAIVYRAIQTVSRIALPAHLPRQVKRQLMRLSILYDEGNDLILRRRDQQETSLDTHDEAGDSAIPALPPLPPSNPQAPKQHQRAQQQTHEQHHTLLDVGSSHTYSRNVAHHQYPSPSLSFPSQPRKRPIRSVEASEEGDNTITKRPLIYPHDSAGGPESGPRPIWRYGPQVTAQDLIRRRPRLYRGPSRARPNELTNNEEAI